MSKHYFYFRFFDELEVGDIFKFSPNINDSMPSKFYTVYEKNNNTIRFNATYGKLSDRRELSINATTEIMVFPNRKDHKKIKSSARNGERHSS